jgi:hypothetical protein
MSVQVRELAQELEYFPRCQQQRPQVLRYKSVCRSQRLSLAIKNSDIIFFIFLQDFPNTSIPLEEHNYHIYQNHF